MNVKNIDLAFLETIIELEAENENYHTSIYFQTVVRAKEEKKISGRPNLVRVGLEDPP